MTINGLCVGFSGHLIGRPLLDELYARGVRMVRHDCLGVGSATDLGNIIAESVDAGMKPMLVMRPEQMPWLSDIAALDTFGPLDIEIWNEPDIGTAPTQRMTPDEYSDELWLAYDDVSIRHRLWAGAISNLDVDSLEWLKASIAAGWPSGVGVSIHRYPDPRKLPPKNAHKGFGSRVHEVERLRAVIGDRPWGCSEFGYQTAEGLTDEQVKTATVWEFQFFAEMGAAFAVAFQINDGEGDHYENHFGWRDANGNWKPVADVLRTT